VADERRTRQGPPMCIVETRGLKKTFGRGLACVEAVRGVDLRVQRGELLVIMGHSGSGKSTLLHMLAGLESPTSGQVIFEGTDIAKLDDEQLTMVRRRQMGVVFQSFNLVGTLTAEENVAIPLALDGRSENWARKRTAEVLERVGLRARSSHLPCELSGGEQQRVAIARALVMDPPLLLADEPTGNLDSASARHVASLLRELIDDNRRSMVLVTHDRGIASAGDRVVRLCDGQMVAQSPGAAGDGP
jgi:putative ABC transport system ATP-binding protein